jgi:F-type H+-transporting ATPase subunit gamma
MGQGKSREIRSKIKSIRNTEKVTRAMKLVSASKLRKAVAEIDRFRSYMFGMGEVILQVMDSKSKHMLMTGNKSKKALIVLFTGERALCGAYNTNALKHALKLEQELSQDSWETEYYAIGKKGTQGLNFRKKPIFKSYELEGTVPTKKESTAIASELVQLFSSGQYGKVVLVYTEFKSAMSKENRDFQLMPLDLKSSLAEDFRNESEEFKGKLEEKTHYFFEPSRTVIINELLEGYINGKLHGSFVESLASEYGSRMVAMENATRNAGELISKLTLKLNRARQAAITQEIAEIVGGAAGLEG